MLTACITHILKHTISHFLLTFHGPTHICIDILDSWPESECPLKDVTCPLKVTYKWLFNETLSLGLSPGVTAVSVHKKISTETALGEQTITGNIQTSALDMIGLFPWIIYLLWITEGIQASHLRVMRGFNSLSKKVCCPTPPGLLLCRVCVVPSFLGSKTWCE